MKKNQSCYHDNECINFLLNPPDSERNHEFKLFNCIIFPFLSNKFLCLPSLSNKNEDDEEHGSCISLWGLALYRIIKYIQERTKIPHVLGCPPGSNLILASRALNLAAVAPKRWLFLLHDNASNGDFMFCCVKHRSHRSFPSYFMQD